MRCVWLTAAILATTVGPCEAQSISNDMACAAAIAHYERNGRIYTLAHGTDLVPIYDSVPASQRNSYTCQPGYRLTPRTLVTSDSRRCTIGYRCTPWVFHGR